jgi:hypothetical protein
MRATYTQEATAIVSRQRYIRAVATAALAAGGALVTTSVLATPAHAGEYHVYSCRTPTGQVAPTEGWSAPEHSGDDTTSDTCEAGGGLVAGLDAHVAHPAVTDRATWSFEAPLGETVASATLWRAGEAVGQIETGSSYVFWLTGVANSGPETQVFEKCEVIRCPAAGNFADPLAPSNQVVVPNTALGSPYLSLNASCDSLGAACAAAEGSKDGYAAMIELFAADLVLSESASPSVSAVEGDLASSPTVSGTSDVAFHATDPGSGIYEVVFQIDGQVVSTVVPEEDGGRCRDVGETTDGLPAFLYPQPCPTSLSADVPFDTAGLSNGAHHLLVSVLDAAGNATSVLDREITVANPSAPGGSGTARGPANGQDPSEEATLTAGWKGHAGTRFSGAYGATRTVEGLLAGPEGHGIADAQIEVSELPASSGAQARVLATPRTTADGRWRLSLPRGIPSCELRFAYRSHLGDATPVATRTLTLSVHAGLELDIAPRVASSGGAILFTGRLLGQPIPAGGKQLVLEARSPGSRWIEFHVVRAGARDGGRFHFAYRFHLAGPASYQFRALSEAEADYPYAGGGSNVVGVYER